MNEAISDLRATIRRVSPLLLRQTSSRQQLLATPAEEAESSVQDELELEAAKELVNSIAALIWNLDSLWDAAAVDSDEKKSIESEKKVVGHSSQQHFTEWNEDAYSMTREGYGLLVSISSDSFVKKESVQTGRDKHQMRQHQEELRLIARTSILELLPSVNTSGCRHFLLGFLPHFIPLSISASKGVVEDYQFWSPPSWLRQDDDVNLHSAGTLTANGDSYRTTSSVEATMDQFLEVFQSLIQTDPSTLAPFLATMSLLFENTPERHGQQPTSEANALSTGVHVSNICIRKKCCQLCISSLPSVSEHDLPSIIHSLFTLVHDQEDSLLAVRAIRKEWISISNSQPKEESVLFIGNVIISFLRSDQTPGAKHIALGFLDEITESLRAHFELNFYMKEGVKNSIKTNPATNVVSTLDAILITALYSQHQYQETIEPILDSLISRQSFIILDLILPVIHIWQSNVGSDKGNHTNLMLYEPLASPLVSLLFYVMIATSCGYLDCVRVGGILPFYNSETAQDVGTMNQALSFACCKAFADLYSSLDFQRREQIIHSLLSMISDSFVQSCPDVNAINKPRRSTAAAPRLIAAAYSACFTLLLISSNHLADVLQIRGVLLDRLLLLASLSSSVSSMSGDIDDVTCILFDLNCVILAASMQGNNGPNGADRSGVSELLILCQKLLFSANLASRTPRDAEISHQHRVTCGIILASRLLRCNKISRGERMDIWNSVVKLLSTSNAILRKLEPGIGIWGLAFLRFASTNICSTTGTPAEVDLYSLQFVDTGSVCADRDIFSVVNNMLASAGVIQIENDLKMPSQSSCGKSNSFLAFCDVPLHYSILRQSAKDTSAPSFVVCAPYFLSGLLRDQDYSSSLLIDERKQMPTSVHVVANYIYDLVDCYLSLGKCSKQGWNPKGWLLAKMQLPCLPESIMSLLGMDQVHRLELDGCLDSFSLTRSSQSSNNLRCKHAVADILTHNKSRAVIVQNLVEFTNSVIISISVSCAVLKHADDHFQRQYIRLSTKTSKSIQHQPDVGDDDVQQKKKKKKRLAALQKLLQFQFAKIQCMRRICKIIFFVLKGIHDEVSRISRLQSFALNGSHKLETSQLSRKLEHGIVPKHQAIDLHKSSSSNIRISLPKLKSSIASVEFFLESRVYATSCSTLWNCLLDGADDNKIKDICCIEQQEGELDTSGAVHHIFLLRGEILHQLQQQITMDSANILSGEMREQSLEGIARVYNAAINLSSYIKSFDKSAFVKCDKNLDRQSISMFISSHYKLLLAAFSLHTKELTAQVPAIDNGTFTEKKRLIQLNQPLVKNNILDLFKLVRACVANAVKDEYCTASRLDNPANVLKEQLIQQFKQCEDSSVACQIIDLLSILVIYNNDNTSEVLGITDLTWRALHYVYNTSGVIVGLPYAFFAIGHSLESPERHIPDDRVAMVQETFSRLSQTAHTIHRAKDSMTCALIHNLLAHWSALVLKGSSQYSFVLQICESVNEVIETSSAKKSRRVDKNNRLSGINAKTCTSVFEVLLQIVVTSLSLSKPTGSCKTKSVGPYDEIIKALTAFGKLMHLFQVHHWFFPRRTFFSVTKASLLVIKLAAFQLHSCVEWRNSQRGSLEVLNDGDDPADACFLQPLLDSITHNCIESVTSFCSYFRRAPSESQFEPSYKCSKALAGLIYKSEGLKVVLSNTCKSHNLLMPRMGSEFSPCKKIELPEPSPSSTSTSKRSLTVPDRFSKRQHYDSSMPYSSVLKQVSDAPPDSYGSESGDRNDDLELGSNDEDSFGAMGDWG